MKNTKLLIGLAVVGAVAYLYSKSKKSSSKTSQSETSQFENKSKADSVIYGGKGFGVVPNNINTINKPVYKGYDPVYNEQNSAEINKQFEDLKLKLGLNKPDPFLNKFENQFGGVPKEKMLTSTSEIITAKPKSIFDGMIMYN